MNICLSEYSPFNVLYKIWKLKDLPVPGFPIIINGILLSIHTKHVNKFSLRALFKAIPFPFSMDISEVINFISASG